jgi:SRSO17 transposase
MVTIHDSSAGQFGEGSSLVQEITSMTTHQVRATAAELVNLHRRFASLFGRKEAQAHSLVYLNGLLLGPERKSVEPIALLFGQPGPDGPSQNQVLALQRFVSVSPWDAGEVQRGIQRMFAEVFVPTATDWPIGTVGILDSSAFVKKGTHSVGVRRQYCGRLGKIENCQVGVFLTGVTPTGTVLLDHQLYLPQEWGADTDRRARTHVPQEVRFQTQPQIAIELLRRTHEAGFVQFDWVVADEGFGRYHDFLDALEAIGQRYLLEVPSNTTVTSYFRMAQYKARGWVSWHHHMSLVALTHLFVSLTRMRLKKSSLVDAGHDAAATTRGTSDAEADT